jgi:Flp pilus assembly protein TadG
MTRKGIIARVAEVAGRGVPHRLRLAAQGRRGSSEDGQALVELAISLSIVMSLVFLLIELCLLFYSYSLISESAREGSRYAMVRGASCVTSAQTACTASAAAINAYVAGLGYPNLGGGAMNVTTSFPDGNQAVGSRVQVSIQYVFSIALPFLRSNPITLNSASTMYILQ